MLRFVTPPGMFGGSPSEIISWGFRMKGSEAMLDSTRIELDSHSVNNPILGIEADRVPMGDPYLDEEVGTKGSDCRGDPGET